MNFKEWLLSEEAAGGADNFFYKLSLYPSDGFDGGEAFVDPKDVWALQQRWVIEKKQGRKFINLDRDDYESKKYVTLHSLNMPEVDSKFWRHRNDDRPNFKAEKTDMEYLGVSSTGKMPKIISKLSPVVDIDLDGIFGDRPGQESKISDDFDNPFRRIREDLMGYQTLDRMPNNANLGVRSKYVGPDETGEGEQEAIPVADFGFNRKRKWPKKRCKKYQRKA